MKSLRAAVVGTGFIGPVHVEGLRRAGVEVAAIIGSTPERSQAAAERLGVRSTHATLTDVLGDSSIDAVHLTTPNRFHFEQATAVLKSGKHVLCEKPLAMTAQESAELVRLAAGTGRAAGVAYNVRFYPLCHEAAERVRNGSVGNVLHVTGSYVQDWLLFDTDFNWRVLADEGGALRAVADIGTHWLDLVQFITGRTIVSVCADLQTVHFRRQRPQGGVETFAGKGNAPKPTDAIDITTDDGGANLLRFDNGAQGSLWVSQTTAGRKNCLRFEIGGATSALAWDSEDPNTLWVGHRDRANESLIRDPALMGASAGRVASYPGGHAEGFPDTFSNCSAATTATSPPAICPLRLPSRRSWTDTGRSCCVKRSSAAIASAAGSTCRRRRHERAGRGSRSRRHQHQGRHQRCRGPSAGEPCDSDRVASRS